MWRGLRRWVDTVTLRGMSHRYRERRTQQEMDLLRHYLGLLYRDGTLTRENVQTVGAERTRDKVDVQSLVVQDAVQDQVAQLMSSVLEADRAVFRPGDRSRGERLAEKQASVRQRLREAHGFDVRVSQSGAHEAGMGVHLGGRAEMGTVVAFYAGVVVLPKYYRRMPGYPDQVTDLNDYLIARYDQSIVDGKDWKAPEGVDRPTMNVRYADGDDEAGLDAARVLNPLAVGHYVNHGTPNVLGYAYNFPVDTPRELHPYIPNRYLGAPGMFDPVKCLIRSYVLLTTRPVQDEELFLDYRYNPKATYPDWYVPVDEEESIRRWGVTDRELAFKAEREAEEAEARRGE